VNLWLAAMNAKGFGADFNQFYCASRLAGTGHLYDWDALRKLEAAHGPAIRTGRLPVVALGWKLIGWMPYPTARGVWLAASIVSILFFALAWPGLNRLGALVALCWSAPTALLLLVGQDTPFWLLFAAAGLLLLSRGKPRLAGVAFALCIAKYHLAVAFPIMLVAQKRWNVLAYGAAAGAVLLGAGFAIEGPGWPHRYWEAVTDPQFSPAAARMANLRGIAWWLPWPGAVEAILAIAVVYLLWRFFRRTPQLGLAGAGAAAGGLLLARHGYNYDFVLLIPLLVFTAQRPGIPVWLKGWAVLLLSPVATLLVVTNKPFLAQVPIVGFVIAALVRECLAKTDADAPPRPA
jgi:hypothetical protein